MSGSQCSSLGRKGYKYENYGYQSKKNAKEGKLKAVVSITIDDEFVIHDIKVIDGDKGLFIAMPSKKTGDGDYRDIAHPINSDTRGMLQRKILEAYNNASDEEV